MSTALLRTPTSRLRFGHAREDITPPVGIYHRMWGAARHDRAAGVHRPVLADVIVVAPADPADGRRMVRAQFDFVGLPQAQQARLRAALSEAAGVPADSVVITHSHSHSSGLYSPDRAGLPGGDLIAPYFDRVRAAAARACRKACADIAEAVITYAAGRCDMAANRDYWDDALGAHACGFNPDVPADDTVLVARIAAPGGRLRAVLVNYACHPTTLAWENALLSPDYVGATRETVEAAVGAPCVFLLGACGDLGPRDGFVGDPATADRNGRQLGFAALSALTGMGAPAADFGYRGVVISGATLGTWGAVPFDEDRAREASIFEGGAYTVPLPLKPLPDGRLLQRDMQRFTEEQRAADAAGDTVRARDLGARAERCRRWLGRIEVLPEGPAFPFPYTVHRFGDALWITCGGEPYSLLQTELRRRFPQFALMVSPVAGANQVAYLLPRDRYGRGLYQEEPSSLAPGCLEALIETITARIESITGAVRAVGAE